MWILIFLFGLSCLVIGWTCFGYYIYLRLKSLLRPREQEPLDCENLPFVSVVVPCYNEREAILGKYLDLREQEYPKDRLEIVFADGGSTDGTLDVLAAQAKDDPTVRIIRCPEKGKISQLNHVLPQLKGSIVVKVGQRVERGQLLGRVGNSGYSDVPHLHYALVDPNGVTIPAAFSRDARVATGVPKEGDVVWNSD